jgi:hypothetical protein
MTAGTAVVSQQFIGNRALVVVGAVLGFVLVPPLARAAPVVINWFLLLVLLGSLVVNQARWIPWLTALSQAARPTRLPEPPNAHIGGK